MSKLAIIPANVVSVVESECSIPNIDAGMSLYNSTKAYDVGDEVVVLSHNAKAVNAVYMSVQVDKESKKNIGNDPIESEFWTWIRPTNLYAALDYYPSTSTTSENELVMTYSMGRCNRFTLLELVGKTLKIEQLDQNNHVIRSSGWQTLIVPPLNSLDCLTYCPKQQSQYVFDMQFDIEQKIRVTLKGASRLEIGAATAGKVEYFGCVHCGLKPSSYLLRNPKRDKYGEVTLNSSDYIKEIDLAISIEKLEYDDLMGRLQDLLATPCMFIPLDSESITTTFGYFDRESSVISCGSIYEANLKIISFKYKQRSNKCQ